jgi:hypothetical protein
MGTYCLFLVFRKVRTTKQKHVLVVLEIYIYVTVHRNRFLIK